MLKTFNLNNYVWVKLKPHGKKEILESFQNLNLEDPVDAANHVYKGLDGDGPIRMQMHDFISKFGEYFRCWSADHICSMDIVIDFEEDKCQS